MSKSHKYAIVTARSPDELTAEVRRRLRRGWTPQGGVAFSQTYDAVSRPITLFHQALVKG